MLSIVSGTGDPRETLGSHIKYFVYIIIFFLILLVVCFWLRLCLCHVCFHIVDMSIFCCRVLTCHCSIGSCCMFYWRGTIGWCVLVFVRVLVFFVLVLLWTCAMLFDLSCWIVWCFLAFLWCLVFPCRLLGIFLLIVVLSYRSDSLVCFVFFHRFVLFSFWFYCSFCCQFVFWNSFLCNLRILLFSCMILFCCGNCIILPVFIVTKRDIPRSIPQLRLLVL